MISADRYYDRDGRPITDSQFSELIRTPGYKTVARTNIGKAEVSTVWLGLDHWGGSDPLIFETMVFDPPDGLERQRRYSTASEAERGHSQTVLAVRRANLRAPLRRSRTLFIVSTALTALTFLSYSVAGHWKEAFLYVLGLATGAGLSSAWFLTRREKNSPSS